MKYKRFEAIISFVGKNDYVLDIGTDHALVPILLFKKGITENIIAIDNSDKPLEQAKKNLLENKLEKKIDLLKSEGYFEVKKLYDVDTIIIAGIGGKNISNIISSRNIEGDKTKAKLILHPTNNDLYLRNTLRNEGYRIIDEKLIKENNICSIIIVAKKDIRGYLLTSKNQFLGPILKKDVYFNEEVRNYYEKRQNFYKEVYDNSQRIKFLTYYKWIRKLLYNYEKEKRNKDKKRGN